MANFKGKDADGVDAYLKASGAGTVGDPHILEHLDTNSAAALTAVQAVQAAVEGTLTVDGSAVTQPVSGTVTANLSAIDNAVLDTIVSNTGAAAVVGPGVEATAQRVTIASDSTGVLSVDDNGGSLTVDNAGITTIAGAVAGTEMQVDIVASATIAVDATGQGDVPVTLAGEAVVLGAGTAEIGKLAAGTAGIGKLTANSGVDIGDVDVTSIAAGETHIGAVGASDTVVTITCSLPVGALTAGDVAFDTQEIANAARVSGGVVILQSVTLLAKDDNPAPIDLVFLDAATSIGTEDSAVSIADADAEDILGIVSIATTDYVDLVNSQVATKSGIGLEMKAGASTSLYVAGITRGMPTYTASGVMIKFAFLRA